MPSPNQKFFIDPNKAVLRVQEIGQHCEITFSSAINLSVRFTAKLIRGTLVQRYKRFLADVRLADGAIVTAHCTNTGSMLGCKEPGSVVYLSRSENKGRKLAFTWEMIQIDRHWVHMNTMHPNRLVAEAIAADVNPELRGYETVRREVKVGRHSRLEICLDGRDGCCYVEVKNVTACTEGAARLSRRGQRARHQTLERINPAQTQRPPRGDSVRRAAARLRIFPSCRRDRPGIRPLAAQSDRRGRRSTALSRFRLAPRNRFNPSPADPDLVVSR